MHIPRVGTVPVLHLCSKGVKKSKACAKTLAGNNGLRQHTPHHSPPVLDALSASSISSPLSHSLLDICVEYTMYTQYVRLHIYYLSRHPTSPWRERERERDNKYEVVQTTCMYMSTCSVLTHMSRFQAVLVIIYFAKNLGSYVKLKRLHV